MAGLRRTLDSSVSDVAWEFLRQVQFIVDNIFHLDAATRACLSNRPLDFNQELLRYENALIKRALTQADGSLTRAAANLSMSYQKLAYIMETRHKDLLKERTPIRRRPGKINKN